ncbi:hypothetical protein WMY93_015020 [Mugilogobius chulae]|uniref:Thioredoxin n=1 Tax=Mugilogobius chulae TaxID=88201 RepID=A0AAW0NWA3_9GOBI
MVKQILSLEEFKAELAAAGNTLVVVDFTAQWCGPCKAMAPKFEKIAEENKDVIFWKVDVDDAPDVSEFCEIKCMPTFHFYKNEKKVDEFSGANQDTLRAKVAEHK